MLMSPTVCREGGTQLYFFSGDYGRMHEHVYAQSGKATFELQRISSLLTTTA